MSAQRFPDGNAYVEAIQNASNVKPLELRTGRYERRSNGLPKPYSGGFTTTFRIDTVTGTYAMRCFTRGDSDLQRRYAAITDFLRLVRNAAFCQAEFVPEGIRVESRFWPIIKMDWVSGRELNAEIEARLGRAGEILELATKFRTMVRELGVLGVAHGDLQHGNIIVDRGALRLIDYDGIFLPALAGMSASEFGHRNYQHPKRAAAPFDGRLDRFSSIAIYTALVALAHEPGLWQRFNNDENVLFRASDFASDGSSALFAALRKLSATEQLASNIVEYLRLPCEAVPTLEQAIATAQPTTKPHPSAVPFAYAPSQPDAVSRAKIWMPNPPPLSSQVGGPQPYRLNMRLRPPAVRPASGKRTLVLASMMLLGAIPIISAATYLAIKSNAETPSPAVSRQVGALPSREAEDGDLPLSSDTGSCAAPTAEDVDDMTAVIDDFHERIAAHDWVRAMLDENQRAYRSLERLREQYRDTVWSVPIVLAVNHCRVRVAVRYLERGGPEMCLEKRYVMEFSRQTHPHWIIHSSRSETHPAACA